MPTLTAAHLTDTGLVRKMNQDSVVVLSADELDCGLDGLFVVADGMGGKAGGEIASRVTVETVPDVVVEVLREQTEGAGTHAVAQALREALEAANDAVYTQSRANPELRGMGTTCVAAVVHGDQAVIGNVGDSRIYLLRDGRLMQLTSDHSLVQEHVRAGELTQEQAKGSRFKNVITRAIGIASGVEPDIDLIKLQSGDTLLLCSDGLTNMVPEPQIGWLLSEEDISGACRKLVEAALNNGGVDNVTVVVVRYGALAGAPLPPPLEDLAGRPSVLSRPPTVLRTSGSRATAGLGALCLLLAAALLYVGSETYYLTSAWPFVKHKAAPRPPEPVEAPPPDYAHLAYGDPSQLLDKAVRATPIACDPAGNVYVVTAESGSVLRVSPDGSFKVFSAADAAPQAARASKHWTADPQGNLYVSDYAGKQITRYDPNGARIGAIGVGKLKGPEDVAVDARGNVYVVDAARVKVFRPLTDQGGQAPGAGASGQTSTTHNSPLTVESGPSTVDRQPSSPDRSTPNVQRPGVNHAPR